MKDPMKALLVALALVTVVLAGCTDDGIDDGGDNGDNGADAGGGGNDGGGSQQAQALFPGYDVQAETGTFWEFYWIESSRTTAQGSGTSGESEWGRTRFTLGEPVTLDGTPLHSVERTGDPGGPIPSWTHLGFHETQLLGSQDGHSTVVLFDAATGEWTGGGFFSGGTARTMTAGAGSVANDIVKTSAHSVGYSHEEGGCTYYPQTGTICDDDSQRSTSTEYYKAGIGPLAYSSSSTFTYSGGGYYSAHEFDTHIGLVDSTLAAMDGWRPAGVPWSENTSMPQPRAEPSVVQVEGKIYALGGRTAYTASHGGVSYHDHMDMQIYDPQTDTWTTGTPYPGEYLWNAPAATIGPYIYVVSFAGGGTDDPDTLARYDTRSDTWTNPEPIDPPMRILYSEAVSIGPYFILVGTISTLGSANYHKTHVLIYDALEEEWIQGASLDERLSTAHPVAMGHDVYVFDADGDYKYNITTGEWTSIGTGSASVIGASLDGMIHLFQQSRKVKTYDPGSETWSEGPLTAAHTYRAGAVTVDDAIYIMGGAGNTDPPEAYAIGAVYRYDPPAST